MVSRVPAVFLDRDGVVNRVILKDGKPHSPFNLTELEICVGASSACADLKAAGYLIIVATNQPDVARGIQSLTMVERINDAIRHAVPIDDILVCYHDDHHGCNCRKPNPGLLLTAAERYGIDLAVSFMIGDREKDIAAGLRAGCQTILIETEYEKRGQSAHTSAKSLREAADQILGRSTGRIATD